MAKSRLSLLLVLTVAFVLATVNAIYAVPYAWLLVIAILGMIISIFLLDDK